MPGSWPASSLASVHVAAASRDSPVDPSLEMHREPSDEESAHQQNTEVFVDAQESSAASPRTSYTRIQPPSNSHQTPNHHSQSLTVKEIAITSANKTTMSRLQGPRPITALSKSRLEHRSGLSHVQSDRRESVSSEESPNYTHISNESDLNSNGEEFHRTPSASTSRIPSRPPRVDSPDVRNRPAGSRQQPHRSSLPLSRMDGASDIDKKFADIITGSKLPMSSSDGNFQTPTSRPFTASPKSFSQPRPEQTPRQTRIPSLTKRSSNSSFEQPHTATRLPILACTRAKMVYGRDGRVVKSTSIRRSSPRTPSGNHTPIIKNKSPFSPDRRPRKAASNSSISSIGSDSAQSNQAVDSPLARKAPVPRSRHESSLPTIVSQHQLLVDAGDFGSMEPKELKEPKEPKEPKDSKQTPPEEAIGVDGHALGGVQVTTYHDKQDNRQNNMAGTGESANEEDMGHILRDHINEPVPSQSDTSTKAVAQDIAAEIRKASPPAELVYLTAQSGQVDGRGDVNTARHSGPQAGASSSFHSRELSNKDLLSQPSLPKKHSRSPSPSTTPRSSEPALGPKLRREDRCITDPAPRKEVEMNTPAIAARTSQRASTILPRDRSRSRGVLHRLGGFLRGNTQDNDNSKPSVPRIQAPLSGQTNSPASSTGAPAAISEPQTNYIATTETTQVPRAVSPTRKILRRLSSHRQGLQNPRQDIPRSTPFNVNSAGSTEDLVSRLITMAHQETSAERRECMLHCASALTQSALQVREAQVSAATAQAAARSAEMASNMMQRSLEMMRQMVISTMEEKSTSSANGSFV